MKRLWLGLLAIGVLWIGTPSPTPAGPLDQRIVALASQYAPDEVTVVKGQPLEFTNADAMRHDVVALRNGPDGKPVFATAVIGTGSTVALKGLERLAPGAYDFTCSLHPSMLGTIYLENRRG